MGDFSIQISANLISRLTEDDEKLKKRTKKTKPRVTRETRQKQTKVVDQKQIADDPEKQKETTTGTGWQVQPPLFLPLNQQPPNSASAELDAIRSVVKESENVVEKLRKHEENMMQEVTQKARDLHEKEFKIPEPKPMPCLAENSACMECYKENANDLTKCAPLAQNFADCARRVRQLAKSADK